MMIFKYAFTVFGAELLKRRTQGFAGHIVDEFLEVGRVCKASRCQWQGQKKKRSQRRHRACEPCCVQAVKEVKDKK
jgi:hypothetical protein